jgi:hypothetical protein
MGLLGQAVTALAGLAAALVPVLAAAGVFGSASSTQSQMNLNPPPVVESQGENKSSSKPSEEQPVQIDFTVSDQLTEGVAEETIVVSLEGARVATLHATGAQPVVTQRVQATAAGNYDYVLDAEMVWYDASGSRQTTHASGRGSIYIDDGMRLDVYLHFESNGVSLSLQSAASS